MSNTTHPRFTAFGRTLDLDVAANGPTAAAKFSGQVAFQVTGTASAITVTMQRSTRDPNQAAGNWATVGTFSGNPAAGMEPELCDEPAAAWWRAVVSGLNGSAQVSISGGGA